MGALLALAPVLAADLDPAELRPHLISLGNDGRLQSSGPWAQTEDELHEAVLGHAPAAAAGRAGAGPRVVLYAHGGLVREVSGLHRILLLKDLFAGDGVFPMAFVWRTGPWETVRNMLADLFGRAGALEDPRARGPEWLDRWIETAARYLGVNAGWQEMKENAEAANAAEGGGARCAARCLAELVAAQPGTEVHLAGHSAGAILLAHFVERLGAEGVPLASVTLLAPACSVALFKATYLPALRTGRIARLRIFVLPDALEREDTVSWYGKSILYLIRNALEAEGPTPIVGLERAWSEDPELAALVAEGRVDLVRTPNTDPVGSPRASRAADHISFEWDETLLQALRVGVLEGRPPLGP